MDDMVPRSRYDAQEGELRALEQKHQTVVANAIKEIEKLQRLYEVADERATAAESKLPRWRNPSDELPPLTEKVLGFWATNVEKGIPGGYMLVRYEEIGEGGAPRWFDDCDDDPGPPPDLWMPLPEPPK